MFSIRRRSREGRGDPDEATVTCFGRKKGKKDDGSCAGLLTEAEGLIRDLRQEILDLRQAQTGKLTEAKSHEEELVRLRVDRERILGDKESLLDEKDRLKEEGRRLREQVNELLKANKALEVNRETLLSENAELAQELTVRSRDLNVSVENALAEQKTTSRMAESLSQECREVKASLKTTIEKLVQKTRELKKFQMLYTENLATIKKLKDDMSGTEVAKILAEGELKSKLDRITRKYIRLQRCSLGKDAVISSLREERSRALIQLWQRTYGTSFQFPSHVPAMSAPAKQQIPLAAVEPFQSNIIASPCVTTLPVKCQDCKNTDADFIKNKTMSLSFELYRNRKMLEAMDDHQSEEWKSSASPEDDDTALTGCDVTDDEDESVDNLIEMILRDQTENPNSDVESVAESLGYESNL